MSSNRLRIGSRSIVLTFLVGIGCVIPGCRPELDAGRKPALPALAQQTPVGLTVAESSTTTTTSLFRNMTPNSGVVSTYRNGEEADHYAILELPGGGVALLDYDGDGLLDLFFPGGGYFGGPDRKQILGYPNQLFKNLGDWTFREVSQEVGIEGPRFYSHGAAVGDYDNDGWPDILVTGWGGVCLYHNESGGESARCFVEVSQSAGLADDGWSTSAAWADLDGDGFRDLYVCHYVCWSFENHHRCDLPRARFDICPPKAFDAQPDRLYRNNRDGTFTDVSQAAGLWGNRPDYEHGNGLGVVIVDVNDDRRPDLFVANDMTPNFLHLNRSTPGNLCFEEVGESSGVARNQHGGVDGSMGVDAADYDGSGRPSLWVTNFENELHGLYRNEGDALFRFSSEAAGIAAIPQINVGFGTGFFDVDNDGWEDLVISNGHIVRQPLTAPRSQRPTLLHNRGSGHFVDHAAAGGGYFRESHLGRGLAIGDIDNDGYTDLIFRPMNEPAALLRNVREEDTAAEQHHWLGIELVGSQNHDVVGSRLILELDGRRLTRFAKAGGSYLSSGDRRLLFGLGTATRFDRLTVRWPSGQEQNWPGSELALDSYTRIEEW